MVTNISSDGNGIAGDFACDRREVFTGLGCGLLLLAAPFGGAHARQEIRSDARLTFFADRPMIDRSGQLPAYRPPSGFRGSGPLASSDEVRLRWVSPFMT